jgi:hypothetical protein
MTMGRLSERATTATTSGNVNVYLPVDFCFYLVSTSAITNVNQFYPLFVASIPATYDNQYFSLSEKNILPLINHPVAQAGANFTSTNSTTSPKLRGLMLQRGQALYVAASGATGSGVPFGFSERGTLSSPTG